MSRCACTEVVDLALIHELKESSIRYVVLGQVVRLRYLGREYSLRVEGIDTLNGTPGSTFSPSKVCSFTEVNMLAEDLYGNNKKTKVNVGYYFVGGKSKIFFEGLVSYRQAIWT